MLGSMSIAPPPTSAPPEAPDAAAYRAPATDLLAILAICASAAGVTVLPLLGSIAGIVLGAIALPRIRRTGAGGRPLAIWGIVLGGAGVVLIIAAIVVAVAGIGAIAASFPTP
jgi:peptidyl-prolyl cis-trans isomerase B (cyclophilin B)